MLLVFFPCVLYFYVFLNNCVLTTSFVQLNSQNIDFKYKPRTPRLLKPPLSQNVWALQTSSYKQSGSKGKMKRFVDPRHMLQILCGKNYRSVISPGGYIRETTSIYTSQSLASQHNKIELYQPVLPLFVFSFPLLANRNSSLHLSPVRCLL